MRETWRPVIGFEGYYSVSNAGRVRSEDRIVRHSGGGEMHRRGRLMRMTPNTKGYPCVQLCREGTITNRPVHLLVLTAFRGQCPDGFEGCHMDGNPSNAKLSNLRWDTREGNFADMLHHGTRRRGSKHHLAKLTADQVRAIRADARTLKAIAADYGVTFTNIQSIKARQSWAWLD